MLHLTIHQKFIRKANSDLTRLLIAKFFGTKLSVEAEFCL